MRSDWRFKVDIQEKIDNQGSRQWIR